MVIRDTHLLLVLLHSALENAQRRRQTSSGSLSSLERKQKKQDDGRRSRPQTGENSSTLFQFRSRFWMNRPGSSGGLKVLVQEGITFLEVPAELGESVSGKVLLVIRRSSQVGFPLIIFCLFPPGEARIKKPTAKTPPKQGIRGQVHYGWCSIKLSGFQMSLDLCSCYFI